MTERESQYFFEKYWLAFEKFLFIVLFYSQFRLCITKTLGKAHAPKVARIQRLSPWESSRDSGWEGILPQFSLSVGYAATSPKGRGFSLTPLYHKSAEKTSSLPIFSVCHFSAKSAERTGWFLFCLFFPFCARSPTICSAREEGKGHPLPWHFFQCPVDLHLRPSEKNLTIRCFHDTIKQEKAFWKRKASYYVFYGGRYQKWYGLRRILSVET